MECLCALAYAFRVRYNMNATEATILFQAGKYHQGVPFSELPIHGSQLTRAMDTPEVTASSRTATTLTTVNAKGSI